MARAISAQRALAAKTGLGGESHAVVFPAVALYSDDVMFESLTGDAVWMRDPPTDVEAIVSIHVDEEATTIVTEHHIIAAVVRLARILIEPCMRDVL